MSPHSEGNGESNEGGWPTATITSRCRTVCLATATASIVGLAARLAGDGVKRQSLARENGTLIVCNLRHDEGSLGILEELHVCAPSLLETKEDSSCQRGTQRQQIVERFQKQRECRLEVDAVCS